jgi:hypothetical protein
MVDQFIRFVAGHFELLGFEIQNWMAIFAGLVVIFAITHWGSELK